MSTPTISQFAGNNTSLVSVGNLDLYYSYQTIVAFRKGGKLTVSENCWSKTTGRHLNAVDGGGKEAIAKRVPRQDFELLLSKISK